MPFYFRKECPLNSGYLSYAGLADRNRLAEVVTRKLQDSFYINVSWDALNTAYSEHPEWFSGLVSGDEN
ncbi:hypothetical protein F9483_17570 [Escherichia coli]|nr:hypothetical protein [Escherichia coli]EFB8833198.1 hypothetical protein [Escherichia coli]EFC2039761.1 hypothetical protein [Escherichia coli]EFD0470569.1 hypothetical protein [Escherichia coli]EFH4151601.1 hypothetical protein [Escherichia coli]